MPLPISSRGLELTRQPELPMPVSSLPTLCWTYSAARAANASRWTYMTARAVNAMSMFGAGVWTYPASCKLPMPMPLSMITDRKVIGLTWTARSCRCHVDVGVVEKLDLLDNQSCQCQLVGRVESQNTLVLYDSQSCRCQVMLRRLESDGLT